MDQCVGFLVVLTDIRTGKSRNRLRYLLRFSGWNLRVFRGVLLLFGFFVGGRTGNTREDEAA